MKRFFSFPNPVNDAAARAVAIGVVAMSLLAFFTGWPFMLFLLTYGFLARVLAGPKISPLGQFAVRVAGPRLTGWEKFGPGPPKRFAQAIGRLRKAEMAERVGRCLEHADGDTADWPALSGGAVSAQRGTLAAAQAAASWLPPGTALPADAAAADPGAAPLAIAAE